MSLIKEERKANLGVGNRRKNTGEECLRGVAAGKEKQRVRR